MFTVTQYLVVACVLPSIIFGAPSLTKRNVFKSLTIDHPSNGVIFPLSVSDRIYGGDVAEPGQFPYQVSLRVKTPIGMYHSCGGSIIASRFVITAGHCYDENREYLVLVGTHSSLFEDGTSYAVQKWFRHEDYLEDLEADNHKLYNDIALIKTKEKIEYNEFVAPIALHPKSFDEGIIAVTLGWGTSDVSVVDSFDGVFIISTYFVHFSLLIGQYSRFEIYKFNHIEQRRVPKALAERTSARLGHDLRHFEREGERRMYGRFGWSVGSRIRIDWCDVMGCRLRYGKSRWLHSHQHLHRLG